jgi:hypothetical protein
MYKCPHRSTWGGKFKLFLRLLNQATGLKKLILVIPHDWQLVRYADNAGEEVWKDRVIEPDRDVLRFEFSTLVRRRPFLAIKVVRLAEDQTEVQEDPFKHGQHLKNLRNRLGIWDHRVALLPERGHWKARDRTEEDPDIHLLCLRTLFEDEE